MPPMRTKKINRSSGAGAQAQKRPDGESDMRASSDEANETSQADEEDQARATREDNDDDDTGERKKRRRRGRRGGRRKNRRDDETYRCRMKGRKMKRLQQAAIPTIEATHETQKTRL